MSIQNLPKPNLCYSENIITDQEIYSYFNLTQEEIDLIEDTIKEPTPKKKKSNKNDN